MNSRLCSTAIVSAVIGIFLISCATVPLTGRTQLDLLPGSTILATSFQQYDEFMKSNKLSSDTEQADLVASVGGNIQKAVEQYMADNNMSDTLRNYQWEYNLIESPEVNAWCMPGGKVVVYTGILPAAQDEDGLAVVMAHEIAHAIARHGNERMSQALLTELGGQALAAAFQEKPETTRKLWMAAFGAGAQLGVILPYSRLHEYEADHLGLLFMAMGGYDPRSAVAFWTRMSQLKSGQTTPEFLNTHPSDLKRIQQIEAEIPEAMKYYSRGQ